MDGMLLGAWGDPNDVNDTWTFHARDKGGYTLDIKEDNKVSSFEAHLFSCGGTRFLDLGPGDLEEVVHESLVVVTLMPLHLLLRVDLQGPNLTLYVSEGDALKSLLKEDPNVIAHIDVDNECILSAPSEALQRYLGKVKDNDELWDDPIRLTRVKHKP